MCCDGLALGWVCDARVQIAHRVSLEENISDSVMPLFLLAKNVPFAWSHDALGETGGGLFLNRVWDSYIFLLVSTWIDRYLCICQCGKSRNGDSKNEGFARIL